MLGTPCILIVITILHSFRRSCVDRCDIDSSVCVYFHFHPYIFTYVYNNLWQTFISTPCDDRALSIDRFMTFKVVKSSFVFLLFDKRVTILPKWVSSKGFRRILDQASSKGNYDGKKLWVCYAFFKIVLTNILLWLSITSVHVSLLLSLFPC